MTMNKQLLSTLVLLTLLVLPRLVHADGMMAPKIEIRALPGVTPRVSSPKQEALIVCTPSTTTAQQTIDVVLRTHFSRGPEALAWVVPVSAKPIHVGTAPAKILDDLATATAPRFYEIIVRPQMKFPIGCSASTADELTLPLPSVTVHASGQAGVYDYSVLTAADAGTLSRWLSDHHYAIPENTEKVLQRYVDRRFYFLAIKLNADAKTIADTLVPPPIHYRYVDTDIVFPIVVSSLSAAPQNEVLLHVLAPHRMGADANWVNAVMGREVIAQAPVPAEKVADYYEALVLQSMQQRPRTVLTEYANRVDASTTHLLSPLKLAQLPSNITRLRTILKPEDMTHDLWLYKSVDPLAVDNNFRHNREPTRAPLSAANTAPFFGATLVSLLWFKTRRPSALLLTLPFICLLL